MVRGGLEAIHLCSVERSGEAGRMLDPFGSGPERVRRINEALRRADENECAEGQVSRDWFAPIIAEAEAGAGGVLQAFDMTRAYIEAGAAGIHFNDQFVAEPLCAARGAKVLLPTKQQERQLAAARLAADVAGVPTLIIARTDAEQARFITADVDERDRRFIDSHARTPEGFFRLKEGMGFDHSIERGLAYAEHADLLWWEASRPDLQQARVFAEAVQALYPGKLLAYNCSASFNCRETLDAASLERFQRELGAMGYKLQFVTLAGLHVQNLTMFNLASNYRDRGMAAYCELQEAEAAAEKRGYAAIADQNASGGSYYAGIAEALAGGKSAAPLSRAGAVTPFRRRDIAAAAAE
jgi:isocitrate lyase